MRVIISTQGGHIFMHDTTVKVKPSRTEPTVVPPVLLDLCTVIILHRFSSPSWWEHLVKHVSADFTGGDAFDKVVRLQVTIFLTPYLRWSITQSHCEQTGQAIVLAPAALDTLEETLDVTTGRTHRILSRFGRQYIIMKTRQRVTADGGVSLLVLKA